MQSYAQGRRRRFRHWHRLCRLQLFTMTDDGVGQNIRIHSFLVETGDGMSMRRYLPGHVRVAFGMGLFDASSSLQL